MPGAFLWNHIASVAVFLACVANSRISASNAGTLFDGVRRTPSTACVGLNLTGMWREAHSDRAVASTILLVHRPDTTDAQVVVLRQRSLDAASLGRLLPSDGTCSLFVVGLGLGRVIGDWIDWGGSGASAD